MDNYNAKDCEQCSSDEVCCNCKNLQWYKLQKQLQAKEQKLAKIKEVVITHKEQRCKTCIYYDDCFDCDDVLLEIIEGKENE